MFRGAFRARCGGTAKSWQLRSESTNPIPPPGKPPSSPWTLRRMVKLLSGTTLALGCGYVAYLYLTEQQPPSEHFSALLQRLPKKDNGSRSNEKLVVRRMSDTLAMYRRSIGEALNEDPLVGKMNSNTKLIEQTLSELQLTRDQVKRLEVAKAMYHQRSMQLSADIAGKLESVKFIKQAKTSSVEFLNRTMPNDTGIEIKASLNQKIDAEFDYLQTVIETLSPKQYEQWIEGLKKVDTGGALPSWVGLLNNTPPVAVPLPTQRVVYVLNFNGDIAASQIWKLRKEITAVIENANPQRGDEVVILLNSSGGVVSSYGLAAAQLERVKAAGLQLTVCIDEVAASGGYLMACVADRVIASPFATIGSIGVVALAPNVYERLQREGIQVDDVTAGKYKRTLTPYRKWNATDKASMQKDVDAIHDIFKGFVKRYRPQVKINEVATGQVWLGYDAIKKGLCDELRTSDDILLDMIKSDAVVLKLSYHIPPKGFLARLRQGDDLDSDSPATSAEVNEGMLSLVVQLARELFRQPSARSAPPFGPSLSYEDRVMIASSRPQGDDREERDEEWIPTVMSRRLRTPPALSSRTPDRGAPLKDSCKYLLVTATNLLQSREISSLQYHLLKELIFAYDQDLYSAHQTSQHILEHILQHTKKLYEVLFQDLTLEHAHIIATTYAEDLDETMSIDTRALVYGEIDFDSFIEVLSVATDGLERMNKFIDLGHGIGRAVLLAALMCDFKEYHGIEILKGLHETSLGIAQEFRRTLCPLLKAPPTIRLTHGSFLMEPHCSSWADSDLVFANSTCFPDELIVEIAAQCASLRVGSRVITFTTSLRSEYFKILYKKRLFMSWGPATVFIHERMPDCEVIPGVVDRYSTSFRPSCSLPIPMPSLNINFSEIDNIDDNYSPSSTITLMPPRSEDSSVATTPSISSKGFSNDWDPDTPTLKAWARRELASSRSQLGRMMNESSEEEDEDDEDNLDTVDTVGGRASKSVCTTSLSSKDDDSPGSDGEEGEDGPRLHIAQLSYRSAEDGRIYPAFNGMSDSSESDQPGESDLDDDGLNEELIERYYRVDDDDGDDEDDGEVDEMYDDTS